MTYETEKQASTGISKRWDPRSGTSSWAQYPQPATHIIGGTQDLNGRTRETRDPGPGTQLDVRLFVYMVPENRDVSVLGFSENFLIFLLSLVIINKFICFMCLCLFCLFLLPCFMSWTLLVFYHLNELLFPSCCKNTNLISTMQLVKIFEKKKKPVIIVRSHIRSSEKDLNQWK